MFYKINKWTQELIQSDPHQVLKIKRKEKQMQLNTKRTDDKQSYQTFLKTGGNFVTQTKLNITYIIVKRKPFASETLQNIKKKSTAMNVPP